MYSVDIIPHKRIKKWLGTRKEINKDDGHKYTEVVEIYENDSGYFDMENYQLIGDCSSKCTYDYPQHGLGSLTAAKRAAFRDTGYKSKDFEWKIEDIT